MYLTVGATSAKRYFDHTTRVLAVAFSPDGKQLASASHKVRLWDATTGAALRRPMAPLYRP
jgi:WD40 repeat protein